MRHYHLALSTFIDLFFPLFLRILSFLPFTSPLIPFSAGRNEGSHRKKLRILPGSVLPFSFHFSQFTFSKCFSLTVSLFWRVGYFRLLAHYFGADIFQRDGLFLDDSVTQGIVVSASWAYQVPRQIFN